MAGIDWEIGVTGTPILPDYSAFLEWHVIAAHKPGITTLFIGQVVNQGAVSHLPLRYREEDYFG